MPSDVTPRRALVLAAGLGTRLDPLTRVRAKPALPVAGEPMIRRIVSWLSAAGVDDVVVNLHHRPESIAAVLGDGSDLGVRVRYSWEQPVVLGSAGGPRKALEVIGEREFLIVNGDTVTDVDLRALAAAHRAGGGMVTMALVPNRWPAQYGGVRLDGQGRVTGFARRGVDAEGSWHFVGVQIATADVFRDVPAGMPASTVGGVYDALLASRPGAVRGFRTDARFYDVGTTADYWGTSWALAGRAGASAEREVAASVLGRRVRVDASAVVSGSLLWDDVEVGAGCRIEDCIVTDGVRVPPHTRWRRRILRVDNGCGLAPREAIEHGLVVSPLEVPQPTGCR